MSETPREMTDAEIEKLNADMASGIIAEIGETLTGLGMDIAHVPPMFYPEAVAEIARTGWRKGLKAAADYMRARNVTASEFYAKEILALRPEPDREGTPA